MLSPKTQTHLGNAKTYLEEHLTVGDYYSEGRWQFTEYADAHESGLRLLNDYRALGK